jgi:dihydrofolate synthase/folylpolyglutamate synthase
MNYQEILNYMLEQLPMYQRIGRQAYRSGLENAYMLDEYFNKPHSKFPAVHVAGTNGKGSVSHMLASILQQSGYKVGLYTSPHLLDFRERIRVNGKVIPKKYIVDFIKLHKPFFTTFSPSFFEISVFLAFEYFVQCNVDIAIIEVGLGGRLDATNIITPLVSVITNIGKDHTEILGDTLEKIAAEKAGIIKARIPVIIGETHNQTLPVFRQLAGKLNAPLHIADQSFKIDYSLMSLNGYQLFNVRKAGELFYPNLKCGLLGHYQRKNTVTVLKTIELLQQTRLRITQKDIYNGIRKVIRNTGLEGRWQVTHYNPSVICDTAHNADGIIQVMRQLAETPHRLLHVVIGFVADKDINEIIKLLPGDATYYFTRLSVPRTMDEKYLEQVARKHGLKGNSFVSAEAAYRRAIRSSSQDDLIVITGSTFLVGDFLKVNHQKSVCE